MNLKVEYIEKDMNFCNVKNVFFAKKSTTDAIKNASKRAIRKTAEATSDLIGNKTTDNIKKASKKLHSKNLYLKTDENETEIPKERYISPEKREKIIDDLRIA